MIRVPFGFVIAIFFIVSLPNILKPPAEIALIACWILHHFTPHGSGAHPHAVFAVKRLVHNHLLKRFGVRRDKENAVLVSLKMAVKAGLNFVIHKITPYQSASEPIGSHASGLVRV